MIPQNSPPLRQKKAFTLTELLVVMTIIVIVLGVGVSGLRDIRGTALTTMGASEMTAKVKSAYKSAVRNKVPTAITLVVKDAGIAQGYLMASASQLESYVGFNDFPVTDFKAAGASGNYGYTPAGLDPRDYLVPGLISTGLDLAFTSCNTQNKIACSGNASATYMECYVKEMSPTATHNKFLTAGNIGLANHEGYISYSILLPSGVERFYYPGALQYIGGDDWNKVGLLTSYNDTLGVPNVNSFLFVNGTLSGNALNTLSANTSNFLETTVSITGTSGKIDEVKVYNLSRSEPILNDLKGGFYFGPDINKNVNTQMIILDAQGRWVTTDPARTETYIGFASIAITGQTGSHNSYDLSGASTDDLVQVIGPKASKLPSEGYIVVYNPSLSSTDQVYELIRYKSFDGDKITIADRGVGGTPLINSDSTTFYYAHPVFFNTRGVVR